METPQTGPSNPDFLSEVYWDVILSSIRAETCILCIGPGLYAEGKLSLEQQMAAFLRNEEERLKIRVYDDGWFHYVGRADKIRPWMAVKSFYDQDFPRADRLFDKLTTLPFHLYISTVPDYRLRAAFDRQGFADAYAFDSYFKGKPYGDTARPAANHPLVYNLLGELDKRGSLVLTYDDFFEYLQSVFAGKSISPVLQDCIQETAENFIFLGLPFDRWYMHLFLRILNQHKRHDLLKYAPGIVLDDTIRTHCQEQFNITFVPTRIEDFVGELHRRCAAEGLLRQASEAWSIDGDHIRDLIRRDELQAAFDYLLSELQRGGDRTRSLLNDAVNLESQFTNLERRKRLNLIDDKDYGVERAKVTNGLLGLVKDGG